MVHWKIILILFLKNALRAGKDATQGKGMLESEIQVGLDESQGELLLCNMNFTFGAFNRLSEARGDFGTVFDKFYIGHFANAGFYLAVGVYKFRWEAIKLDKLVYSSFKLV